MKTNFFKKNTIGYYNNIFVLFLLLLFSTNAHAQLKKFTAEIPHQPKIRITDSIQSLTLLNRSISPEYLDYNEDSLQIYFLKRKFKSDLIVLDKTISDTLLQIASNLLFESERFDVVIPVDRTIPRKEHFSQTPAPLDWNYVKYVCNTYNTDALLVLENLATRVVTNYTAGKKYDDYENYSEKYYYASIDYYYRIHWRLYAPKNEKIIYDVTTSQDTLFWDNEAYSLTSCFSNLPTIKQAGIETAINIAFNLSESIAPKWDEATRYYYVLKDSAIDKSVTYAIEGDWDSALNNWMQYVEEGNKSARSKIMLNIALAYEMTGDIDEAYNWAKKSYKTNFRDVTRYYLKELKELKE